MSAAAGTNGAPLSKRARKRLAKAEAFREKKRLKKEAKREARRARASTASATNAESSSTQRPTNLPAMKSRAPPEKRLAARLFLRRAPAAPESSLIWTLKTC